MTKPITGAGEACSGRPRPLVPEHVRPLARTVFYASRGFRARLLARLPRPHVTGHSAPIFVIGCGRSGTTLLGKLLAVHPAVSYRYEPNHLWAAIEPATDFLHLYSRAKYHCLLGSSALTPAAQRRFRRLMTVTPGRVLVEKSPTNALRVGYLDAMAPDARFVHIVRDGVDVARSIERMAAVTRRMAFRQPLNEWWGVGDAKWAALKRDGHMAGYYPGETGWLTTDAQRGAYEWLLSVQEARKWQAQLGPRFAELRYQDLTNDPRTVLAGLARSLGLSCPDWWLEQAAAAVREGGSRPQEPLTLPGQMCADFNRLQAGFGFSGRAVGLSGPAG